MRDRARESASVRETARAHTYIHTQRSLICIIMNQRPSILHFFMHFVLIVLIEWIYIYIYSNNNITIIICWMIKKDLKILKVDFPMPLI